MTALAAKNFHDPENSDCPWNDPDYPVTQGLGCTCVLRGNRLITKFDAPEASTLTDKELREAYQALRAHHVEETTELARQIQRPRAFAVQRIQTMRTRPRMWASSQESFVLQIVAILDVLGVDFTVVRDKFNQSVVSEIDVPVKDAYAMALATQALDMLK
jgi:hypothetical protein